MKFDIHLSCKLQEHLEQIFISCFHFKYPLLFRATSQNTPNRTEIWKPLFWAQTWYGGQPDWLHLVLCLCKNFPDRTQVSQTSFVQITLVYPTLISPLFLIRMPLFAVVNNFVLAYRCCEIIPYFLHQYQKSKLINL